MRLFKGLDSYKDARGAINSLLPEGATIKSALHITGNKGAVRGNHWHKKDTHYCYVVEGIIRYDYIESRGDKIKRVTLKPGSLIYTPTIERHRFTFITGGSFLALATEVRSQKAYEKEIVREVF